MTDMFADPASVSSSFSDRLEKINDEDQVAITINVDTVHGVAGLLQPGDYVNVMVDRPTADRQRPADTVATRPRATAPHRAVDEIPSEPPVPVPEGPDPGDRQDAGGAGRRGELDRRGGCRSAAGADATAVC